MNRLSQVRPPAAALALSLAAALLGIGLLTQAALRSGFENELSSVLPGTRWSGPAAEAGGTPPTLVWRRFTAPSGDTARSWIGASWHFAARTRSGAVTVFTKGARTLYLVTTDPNTSTLALQRSGGCGSQDAAFPEPPPDDWLQFGSAPSQAVEALDGRWPDLTFPTCVARGYWTVSEGGPPRSMDVPVARFVPSDAPSRAILMSTHLFISGSPASDRVDLGLGQTAVLDRRPGGAELRWKSAGAQYRYLAIPADRDGMLRTACRTLRPALLCWRPP